MFNAIALVLSCMLQWVLLTTEGQRGTNRYVFYAVEMDGGVPAAGALAQQHGLEFISQVSAYLKTDLITCTYGPAIYIL